jgi:hypothetical protein
MKKHIKARSVEALALNIYNHTSKTEAIDLFSKKNKPHTGVIDMDTVMPKLSKSDMFYMIRFHAKGKVSDFLFNSIYINNEKYMYGSFLSQFQHNIHIISVPIYEKFGTSFKVELLPDTHIRCNLYASSKQNHTSNKSNIEKDNNNIRTTIKPNRLICVIAENEGLDPIEVNLFDKKYSKDSGKDEDVKIEIAIDNRKLVKNKFGIKSIRVISENKQQLLCTMLLGEKHILPTLYQNEYAIQDVILDMNNKEPIMLNKNDEVFVKLLPKTKVMYIFNTGDAINPVIEKMTEI